MKKESIVEKKHFHPLKWEGANYAGGDRPSGIYESTLLTALKCVRSNSLTLSRKKILYNNVDIDI